MLLVPTRGEQESEIKAQEPETERPKDQGKVKRTLQTAREALATEERAQQKTLAKLRSDKAKITAAEIQLKEEKEKSARSVSIFATTAEPETEERVCGRIPHFLHIRMQRWSYRVSRLCSRSRRRRVYSEGP
jgi:hypothetical protein